jgi:hypothetical protein
LWHVFNYIATQKSRSDSPSGGGSYAAPATPPTSISDERLRVLGRYIVRDEETLDQARSVTLLAQLSKRVHLAELAGRYNEEKHALEAAEKQALKAAERKRKRGKELRQQSLKDRYTDLLFPETIGQRAKPTSKPKERKGKTKERRGKPQEDNPRGAAKGKVEYWIRLGTPLAIMTQRNGVGSLAVLPKNLTDKK